ncbi:hypothetical protein NQ318_017264 [Aromia moschata]|uniref:Activating signal cointegrator 1 complex subunit 3 n=1 Tax=Aromia moschata TaxID=1265417 RepID=A0AAV8X7K3_9CUCU|nr:hypothetical protein NQ318_017264 [Aromia moschata]
MVAADQISGVMTESSNFYKDYHGVQLLKDISLTHITPSECEYERLQDVFKYADDSDIVKGLIYLKYLHDVIKKEVVAKIKDEIPIDDLVYKVLVNITKDYMESHVVNKHFFLEVTTKLFGKNKGRHPFMPVIGRAGCRGIGARGNEALENITERLPNNFFKKEKRRLMRIDNKYDPCQGAKLIDPIFYIPLKEDFQELDKTLKKAQKNDFSLLYVKPKEEPINNILSDEQAYPLETMFECYKDVMPNYDYREFKTIIHTELNSSQVMMSLWKNGVIKSTGKKNPAELIAGQVTVQSEKESLLSKKLRKMEKKDKQRFSSTEIRQFSIIVFNYYRELISSHFRTEVEYEVAKSTPIFKKAAPQNLDPEEYPHVHDQLRNHMVTKFTIPGGKKGDIQDMELVKVKTLDTTGQLIVYVCPMKALATEMVTNFGKKLAPIGITVKECTGDMQLTKKEIAETQMLVTTPEKWDVITRKGAVDTEVVGLVKLLIIDEVHLLNGSRGPVIEALVARTLRQVVSSQSMIRIVALSATLPGYLDVATFLKVNTRTGLFFFDNRYRSVPLTTSFIGCKKKNETETMDMVCYEKVVSFVREGHQAMVFVTSRNATASVAKKMIEIAQVKGTLPLFEPEKDAKIARSGYKSGDLSYLIPQGFGIHHAGMVRSDRLEVERLFRVGHLKVIVCTTTLAWGVNLPAHAVIIRGTLHYDATKSTFVDMDMLDVQQIFGRAGRPQYDTSGYGIIITSMANMSKYMGLMTSQVPIESQFLNCIPDNLNAEIVLGTVSNVREAMEWLANTFLFVRIKKNPLVYGLTYNEIWDTKQFNQFLQLQLDTAAKTLEQSQMIRFDTTLGELRPTNFGRIASFYYISYKTMELFYERFDRHISESGLIQLISEASEFAQIQVRMDEIHELDRLRECNEYDINLDFTSHVAKVIILIQANISRAQIRVSSLVSDCQFIMQDLLHELGHYKTKV